MGYSLSWLAIKGKPPQAVRDELGLRPTGAREEIPESNLSGAQLPNGWYLIVSNHTEQVAPDAAMQRFSVACGELVTCFVEEHVMVSKASGWKDGQRKWSVTHDAQKGRSHLEVHGEMPPAFAAIQKRLFASQSPMKTAGSCDHVFSIPVELAESVAGYRHDKDIPGTNGAVFEVLAEASPKKKSFFKKIFGG